MKLGWHCPTQHLRPIVKNENKRRSIILSCLPGICTKCHERHTPLSINSLPNTISVSSFLGAVRPEQLFDLTLRHTNLRVNTLDMLRLRDTQDTLGFAVYNLAILDLAIADLLH